MNKEHINISLLFLFIPFSFHPIRSFPRKTKPRVELISFLINSNDPRTRKLKSTLHNNLNANFRCSSAGLVLWWADELEEAWEWFTTNFSLSILDLMLLMRSVRSIATGKTSEKYPSSHVNQNSLRTSILNRLRSKFLARAKTAPKWISGRVPVENYKLPNEL